MKVSLVVFRFEVTEYCPVPEHLDYEAASWSMPNDGKDKKSYACAVVGQNQLVGGATSHGQFPPDNSERHRGMRNPRSFTFETYMSKGEKNEAEGVRQRCTASEEADFEVESLNATGRDTASADKEFVPVDTRSTSVASDEGSSSRPNSGKSRHKSHSPAEKSMTSIHFFSGNPMVETTEGIMHLYKENQLTSLDEQVCRPDMISILSVPAALTTKDLIQFVAPVMSGVEHMKIIRDSTPNQYMVLIKFNDQRSADEFYRTYNNIPFNSLESDICHLVYVSRVETLKSSEGAAFPVPGLTELPNCPVCLERMDDSVDGILTILCNHAFHGSCLSQWGDLSCPVCRYVQTPEVVADNKCLQCETEENLWICLICGHVGCGRYQGGHARRHYEETQHTYSMQLGNNRVWDYAGDNYVHRLVQNKSDGKLVEVDEHGMGQDEKLDSITLEYTYLLTSQLESQRLYFEEKMKLIEEEAQKVGEEHENRSKKTMEECSRLEKRLQEIQKVKVAQEKKTTTLTTKLTKVTSELEEEKEMNKCLRDYQHQWQIKFEELENKMVLMTKEKDGEIRQLQEQLRDLMFHLEANQKITGESEGTQEDIAGGHIIVGDAAAASSSRSRKGRKKGR